MLINKRDNFEIIRDQIGMILVTEAGKQQALARAQSLPVKDWELNVYTERFNLWEQVLNQIEDRTPIVNIWLENISYDKSASNISERQKATATYNIDCYGFGLNRDDHDGGFISGDEDSARVVQRAARYVRNILMSSEYTYLGLRGVVWERWPSSITQFQPQLDDRASQNVTGVRIAFSVGFNEFSPQYQPVNLCELAMDLNRADNGQLITRFEYDYGSN